MAVLERYKLVDLHSIATLFNNLQNIFWGDFTIYYVISHVKRQTFIMYGPYSFENMPIGPGKRENR